MFPATPAALTAQQSHPTSMPPSPPLPGSSRVGSGWHTPRPGCSCRFGLLSELDADTEVSAEGEVNESEYPSPRKGTARLLLNGRCGSATSPVLGGLVGSIEKTLAEEHSTADAALWWLEPSKGLVGAADDPMSSLSAHNLRQPLGDRGGADGEMESS